MEDKRISVIIAVYNIAEYLPQCLDSVLGQTYRNLEVICVDDGATDNSRKICDAYAEKDARVRVIHKKNGGSASARNAGLEIFTGDYVSIIDGDDWLEPNMYEKLAAMMKPEEGIDVAACGYFMDYPDRCEAIKNILAAPETPMPIRDFLFYVYCRDDYRGVASYLWNKLFPRSFFDGTKAKVRFELEFGSLGDDIYAAAQCFMLADKIQYTAAPGYHYRQRDNSAFQGATDKKLKTLNILTSYEKIIELYLQNGISQHVLDYVERFYVYHAGLLMEYAHKIHDMDKLEVLRHKVAPYLEVYQRTNANHPERYEWLASMMSEGD